MPDALPAATLHIFPGLRHQEILVCDLEKACNRVLREELWYCIRKSEMVGKYVQLVQDMYKESKTVVR